MRVIDRLSGGVAGFFLYPASQLFKVGLGAAALLAITGIIIPLVPLVAGAVSYFFFRNAGFWGALGIGLLAAAVTAIVGAIALVTLPVVAATYILDALFVMPFKAAKKGWTEGFKSVLKNVFGRPSAQDDPEVVAERNAANQNGALPSINILSMLRRGAGAISTVATSLSTRPITVAEFNTLALTDDEVNALASNRLAPLTREEMSFLSQDTVVTAKLEAYKNLRKRLDGINERGEFNQADADSCVLLQARPETADTVILVKQYKSQDNQQRDQWLPVPGAVHIFSKSYIKQCFTTSECKHPITRESIMAPTAYQLTGSERSFQTRYVFHNYYVNDTDAADHNGLSQEINDLTKALRARLQELNYVETAANDPVRGEEETLPAAYGMQ